MATINLKWLLRKNKPAYQVVESVALTLPGVLAIFDEQDALLFGKSVSNEEGTRSLISMNGQQIGSVSGPEQSRAALVQLLERLLITEAEKRELSEEVLQNYRELNLLYDLSERLISSPEPPAIANMTLKEASRLVPNSAGWVLLLENDGRVVPVAKRGRTMAFKQIPGSKDDLVAAVLASGVAEIRNNEPFDSFFETDEIGQGDLICAPLKTEQRILGVLLLVGNSFQVHHLKLLNTVALQAGPALEIARLYQVAIEQGRMEQELRQAYEVQASLIPRQSPAIEGWEFAGRWRPARGLSGDYYDFIALNDGQLGLVIGDVADKGMPSSLFMVFTRSAVRSAVSNLTSPVDAIEQANDLVAQESQDGLFVTLFYGTLEPQTGRLQYVNAGHNPPMLLQCRSGEVLELGITGIPLGIIPGFSYKVNEVHIHPGDILLIYTDGVTEAINADFEEFGSARLRKVIKRFQGQSAEAVASGLETSILEFIGERSLFDDLTLVVIKRNA